MKILKLFINPNTFAYQYDQNTGKSKEVRIISYNWIYYDNKVYKECTLYNNKFFRDAYWVVKKNTFPSIGKINLNSLDIFIDLY